MVGVGVAMGVGISRCLGSKYGVETIWCLKSLISWRCLLENYKMLMNQMLNMKRVKEDAYLTWLKLREVSLDVTLGLLIMVLYFIF